jgi:hypothetical protein
VRAEFRLSNGQIEDIREKLKTLPKCEPVFSVEVKDEAGVVIAEVEKVLHCAKEIATADDDAAYFGLQTTGDSKHVHP